MQFRTVAVVALALLVLLAGCGGFGGPQAEDADNETNETGAEDETNESDTEDDATDDAGAEDNETDGNETDDETNDTDSNDTETGDDDVDDDESGDNETDDNESEDGDIGDNETDDNESNESETGDDETDDNESDDIGSDENETEEEEAWSEPEPPNTPMEDKKEDRISNVTFVDRVPENGSDGYSNFNLEVVANTSMENVDPADHGDVQGEPYFMVKINGELIERTDVVAMEEDGEFHIQVRQGGLEQFESGELDVSVWLMDRDSEWDDVYDTWEGEIQYDPDASESEDE